LKRGIRQFTVCHPIYTRYFPHQGRISFSHKTIMLNLKMKKANLLVALLFCFTVSAQFDNTFGIKAGTNYSQFRPDIEFYGEKVLDFKGKIGYYVGGFF